MQTVVRKKKGIIHINLIIIISNENNLFRSVARTRPRLFASSLRNSLNRGPQSKDTDQKAGKKKNDVGDEAASLLSILEPVSVMHPEPEDTRKAVREPGGEESTDEAEEVVKNRDGLGDDHRKRPGAEGDGEPDKGG